MNTAADFLPENVVRETAMDIGLCAFLFSRLDKTESFDYSDLSLRLFDL